MALPHAASGELIDVRPLGPSLREARSTTLVRSDHLEIFRLVLAAGARVPDHKMPRVCQLSSVSTMQCLEGCVEIEVDGDRRRMPAGTMLYLSIGVPHALTAIEDSSVLVTMLVERA